MGGCNYSCMEQGGVFCWFFLGGRGGRVAMKLLYPNCDYTIYVLKSMGLYTKSLFNV